MLQDAKTLHSRWLNLDCIRCQLVLPLQYPNADDRTFTLFYWILYYLALALIHLVLPKQYLTAVRQKVAKRCLSVPLHRISLCLTQTAQNLTVPYPQSIRFQKTSTKQYEMRPHATTTTIYRDSPIQGISLFRLNLVLIRIANNL